MFDGRLSDLAANSRFFGCFTEGYFGPEGVLSHDLRARTELLPSLEVWKARGGTIPRSWPAPR